MLGVFRQLNRTHNKLNSYQNSFFSYEFCCIIPRKISSVPKCISLNCGNLVIPSCLEKKIFPLCFYCILKVLKCTFTNRSLKSFEKLKPLHNCFLFARKFIYFFLCEAAIFQVISPGVCILL